MQVTKGVCFDFDQGKDVKILKSAVLRMEALITYLALALCLIYEEFAATPSLDDLGPDILSYKYFTMVEVTVMYLSICNLGFLSRRTARFIHLAM